MVFFKKKKKKEKKSVLVGLLDRMFRVSGGRMVCTLSFAKHVSNFKVW